MPEVKEQPSFDWRTHVRDKKTGKIARVQHYTYTVNRSGEQWVERDGKRYHVDGSEYKTTTVQKSAPAPVVEPKVAAPVEEAKKPAKKAKKAKVEEPKEGE